MLGLGFSHISGNTIFFFHRETRALGRSWADVKFRNHTEDQRRAEVDFNVSATRISFKPGAAASGGVRFPVQREPGSSWYTRRGVFWNKDMLLCSAIVITSIHNDLMAVTNCIICIESRSEKRIVSDNRWPLDRKSEIDFGGDFDGDFDIAGNSRCKTTVVRNPHDYTLLNIYRVIPLNSR